MKKIEDFSQQIQIAIEKARKICDQVTILNYLHYTWVVEGILLCEGLSEEEAMDGALFLRKYYIKHV